MIARGEVVGYPTETVWGLAAAPEHAAALYRVKGREAGKPVQVSFAQVQQALDWAEPSPALGILSTCWPGPLTVVARASARCPAELAPGGWVGLRIPAHPIAQALLGACGGVLATTSLNPAGAPPATTFQEAQAYGLTPLLLGKNSERSGGQASTVIQLSELPHQTAVLVRRGALAPELLAQLLATQGITLPLSEGQA